MTTKDYSLKTELYYTHGIEIENHLVSRKTGEVVVGDVLLNSWNEMFEGAAEYLKKLKKDKKTPKEISKRIQKVEVKEEVKRERKLKFVFVHYKLGRKTIPINVFGPDPNIGQITWLLELVTPPCEYLEELEWWIDTLYIAALQGLPPEVALLPIGLNPTEKRVRSGLTCGEHHHIGIPKPLRIPIYNMLRNFVPHLIALSSTSPFLNQAPSGKVRIREDNGKKQIIGRCIHSFRLTYNTGQMGPNIPTYLPALDNKSSRKDFATAVKKTPPDDRMVDLFPFTDYSTIEARFFDAVPWPEVRFAIVLLIQALCQKTSNLLENKEEIPKVSSHSLFENRRKAVQFGLLAQFTPDRTLTSEFSKFYNFDITQGKKASKLLHSMKSLLVYVQDELEGFGSDLINYLLIPILGSKEFTPPLTVADYLLALYQKSGENMSFLPNLYYTKEIAYPLRVDGSFTSLQPQEIEEEIDSRVTGIDLQKSLQKDLAKKKIATKVVKKKPKPPKKIRKPKKPKVKPKKKPVRPPKIKVEKPPVKAKKVRPKEIEPITPAKVEPIEPIEKETIISAFEENEDLEIYSPTIAVEPKYQKIESKIANVMRTRRKEIEIKRREFFRAHLKEERVKFKPSPKKTSPSFPNIVSGSEVFGYIQLSFSDIKKAMYKFRNNPITFIFKSVVKGEKEVETKVRSYIDIVNLERRRMANIPLSFSLGHLSGEIKVTVEAITATNETLLPANFSFRITRKDEILIEPKEFYITGNYGPIECIYNAVNNSRTSEKGELELYLVTQALTDPILIYKTNFNLKPKENLEMARSIDLIVNYHHSPFYIASRITIGRFKKTRMFKTIRVPMMNEVIVDWNFVVDPEKKYDLWNGVKPKTAYEIDFVFHFIKKMNPVTINIFVNTFPLGQSKRLASFRIQRDIDPGDEFVLPNVKFKTPKKCGYLFFDAEMRTEQGIIPVDLISESIGVHSSGITRTSFEETRDLVL